MTIVLLPGLRGDPAEHAPLAAALPGLPVLSLALPELRDPRATLADHAAALLPHLPAPPLLVVGASFGGLLAWALPAGRVTRLVTIGTLPAPSPAQARCRWMAPLVRRLPAPVYTRAYGARARREWLADDPDPARYAALSLPPAAVIASRLAAIGRWGLPARPPASATWAWGADDRFVTWSAPDVEAIGATAAVLPGGHRPHLSHPAAVAALVRAAYG